MRTIERTKHRSRIVIKHNLAEFSGALTDIYEEIGDMFERIVEPVFKLYPSDDTYGITFNSLMLNKPIWIGKILFYIIF